MFLQYARETIDVLPKRAKHYADKAEGISRQTSTFEDLLLKITDANPDLILLATEIRRRLEPEPIVADSCDSLKGRMEIIT